REVLRKPAQTILAWRLCCPPPPLQEASSPSPGLRLARLHSFGLVVHCSGTSFSRGCTGGPSPPIWPVSSALLTVSLRMVIRNKCTEPSCDSPMYLGTGCRKSLSNFSPFPELSASFGTTQPSQKNHEVLWAGAAQELTEAQSVTVLHRHPN